MNLQSKFWNCITTETLTVALLMKAGRNYRQTDRWRDGCTEDLNRGLVLLYIQSDIPICFIHNPLCFEEILILLY